MGNRFVKNVLVAATLCVVAACGGGGGGGAAPASPIQGAWEGTISTGFGVQTLILEDGSSWTVSAVVSGGSVFPDSLAQGTFQATSGSLSSSDLRLFDFDTGTATSATASGTFAAGTSINATVTPSGTSVFTAALTPIATSTYDYNQAATLAAISGNWTGSFSSSESGMLAVAANGSFSTTTSLGCLITGTFTPRASGKNVYDVSATFGSAPCSVPGAAATGVAVIAGTGATAELVVAVTNAARTLGGAFFGAR